VHHSVVLAVKREEFVSDRMTCIVLKGCRCNVIALNVQMRRKVMIHKTVFARN